jgi:hypothetical protein
VLSSQPALPRRYGALLAVALGLLACNSPQTRHPTLQPSAAAQITAARLGGIEHYRIDPQRSQVLIMVYRDGPMAALGHNHVLSVGELAGEVTLAVDALQGQAGEQHPERSSFALRFPVAALALDEPALRAEQGTDFEGSLDTASVEGTRSHMLGEQLLDANHYAYIKLQSERVQAQGDHWLAIVHIDVRGFDAEAQVPIALESVGDELLASGEFDLSHAQLGLKPYSVALGALRVAENLHLRYRLIAQREPDSGNAAEDP